MTSTKPVVCPFCGKGPIQIDTKVCESCGKDLSNFWRIYKFLEKKSLPQSPAQQTRVEQKPVDIAPAVRPSLETRPPTQVQPQPQPTAVPPRPEAVATKPIAYLPQPTGKVRRTKLKLVALAVALIAVVAIGLVASAFLGLISLPFPTGTSQGSTCTITGPGVCHIETLNIAGLSVTNSSYNGNQTLDIRFGVNETGTNPINITIVRFDNAPLQNGPPPPTAKNFTAFWWSTSNSLGAPTEIIGNVEFMLEVPWVQLQHENTPLIGVHTVTLVDSSGKSYAFSFNGTLNIP